MNFLRLLSVGIIFSLFASTGFAWGWIADTWNTSQVYAGSVYAPSSHYSGWVYNSYAPNSGYPVMGGGRYYPPGYGAGSYYAPVTQGYYYGSAYGYNYNSYVSPSYPGHYVADYYYGSPVHATLDIGYSNDNFYVRCTYYSC